MQHLRDPELKPSSMRLMSFLSLLSAIGLAFLQALGQSSPQDQLILYFLIGAFGPKAIQRFAEQKKGSS